MNLVAKEYVAAQDPANPGVLVLSEFAGAAKELDAALLVNPHDIDGMAQRISTALVMSLEERRERWLAMIGKLRSVSALSWFADFVRALGQVRPRNHSGPAAAAVGIADRLIGGTGAAASPTRIDHGATGLSSIGSDCRAF